MFEADPPTFNKVSIPKLRTFKKFSSLLLAGPSILGASPVTFKDHPPLDVYDTIRNMAFTQMSPYLGASQHILYSHPCITEWKTSLHKCHPWISSWYRRKKYHLPRSCLSIAALQSLLHTDRREYYLESERFVWGRNVYILAQYGNVDDGYSEITYSARVDVAQLTEAVLRTRAEMNKVKIDGFFLRNLTSEINQYESQVASGVTTTDWKFLKHGYGFTVRFPPQKWLIILRTYKHPCNSNRFKKKNTYKPPSIAVSKRGFLG